MDARYTGNVMTLAHFHDFYMLEALQAAITMAKSAKSELQFKHSFTRLESDVTSAFESLSHEMALRIYVYLWAAAIGEARHSYGMVSYHLDDIAHCSRNSAYTEALNYFPSDENVTILKDVFNQKSWGGAYGGRAWLNIVEAMSLYGKVTNATFVDHAVDLEHNGGNVFNKDASFGLNCFARSTTGKMQNFLSFKFSHDILRKPFDVNFGTDVSLKVRNLVIRYANVVLGNDLTAYAQTQVVIAHLNPELEWLSGYSVEWDTNTLKASGNKGHGYSNEEKYVSHERREARYECYNCGRRLSENDVYSGDGQDYCVSCYNREFTHCENCHYIEHIRDMQYSEVLEKTLCDSCYEDMVKTCNKCHREIDTDEAIDAEHHQTYYWLCEDCADEEMYKCSVCEEWYPQEACYICEDDWDALCPDHHHEYECDECGKHYGDMQYHKDNDNCSRYDKPVDLRLQMKLFEIDENGKLTQTTTALDISPSDGS